MPVVSRIRFRVARTVRGKTICDGAMGGATGVPAIGFVVVGMIVLARFENGLPSLLVGPIPGNGMVRRLDRERRNRG